MADYETLYPGRFLKKETLAVPKVIRILDLQVTQLEGEKGIEPKTVMKYKDAGGEGEMVLCKTNAILISFALGDRDYEKWKGHLVTIWNNPTVDLKGKKVGGIRVCGSPEMTKPVRVEVKRPRRKTAEVYELTPTDKKGVATTAPAAEPPLDLDAPVAEAGQ